MKTLKQIKPKPEQLKLIIHTQPGIRVIRGAAGSGKTTTSLLMLKTAIGYLLDVKRENSAAPIINVKVFTFNKTLRGYINTLVAEELSKIPNSSNELNVEITTLGQYLYHKMPSNSQIIDDKQQLRLLGSLGNNIPLPMNFLVDEVNYLLGRLSTDTLEQYIKLERTGRGSKPRVDQQLRRRILDEVVYPYINNKKENSTRDWNDLAEMASMQKLDSIDIAVIDEAQDFSANQLRAIINQLAPESITTIVLDSAQQIYKRGFTWKDIGITQAEYFKLQRNYRNTFQIANFAIKLLTNANILLNDDATLPILSEITRQGEKPIVVQGVFNHQMSYILNFIRENIDLESQSIGFLHPKGYGWFDYVVRQLQIANIPFVDIARQDVWLPGNINVALSTIHSAKGLEFDFVFIVGLETQHFNLGEGDHEDSDYTAALKLVAMAITRAKENVILSYKKETMPTFLSYLDPATYKKVVYEY